jgi:hypothetical protein
MVMVPPVVTMSIFGLDNGVTLFQGFARLYWSFMPNAKKYQGMAPDGGAFT